MSQGTASVVLAVLGLAVLVGAWWAFAFARGSKDDRAALGAQRRIRVHGRYEPAEVHVPAGAPARLLFFREETAPCSERVVFSEFGLSVGLPPFREIAVDVPALEPGVHAFTCEREMLHGRLVVDPAKPLVPGGAA